MPKKKKKKGKGSKGKILIMLEVKFESGRHRLTEK